jgi:hypothetical protein
MTLPVIRFVFCLLFFSYRLERQTGHTNAATGAEYIEIDSGTFTIMAALTQHST